MLFHRPIHSVSSETILSNWDAFIRSHCVFWPFDIGWFSVLSFSPRQVCVSTMHLASSQVTHEIKVMKKMKQLSSESLAAQTYFDSHSDQTRQLDNEAHSAQISASKRTQRPIITLNNTPWGLLVTSTPIELAGCPRNWDVFLKWTRCPSKKLKPIEDSQENVST